MFLLRIHQAEPLIQGPLLGPLFETAVVMELVKRQSFSSTPFPFYFFRTADGLETDLVFEKGPSRYLAEIESNKTPSPRWGDMLAKIEKLVGGIEAKFVLAPIEKKVNLGNEIVALPWSSDWEGLLSCS